DEGEVLLVDLVEAGPGRGGAGRDDAGAGRGVAAGERALAHARGGGALRSAGTGMIRQYAVLGAHDRREAPLVFERARPFTRIAARRRLPRAPRWPAAGARAPRPR